MFKLRKVISIIVFFILISSFLPVNIKAANDINLISTTTIKVEEAKAWATKKSGTDTFVKLADLYWNNYKSHGNINPAIAYVQSALETGYGKFGGVIDESYKNPCGMKVNSGGGDTDSNAHQRFNSWEDGVKAHLDHLALYAGATGYPRSNTTDPRHFSYILGKAKNVQALSSAWASNASYGDNIMKLYNELNDFSNNIKIVQNIESKENLSVLNNKINIKGWAISNSNISKVMVYLDDKYVGNANYGIIREDVYNVYPNYKNSKNSGYSINIDVSNVDSGNHKIKIIYQGEYGYTLTSYSNIIINKNQNNSSYMSPRGSIDYPSENESIKAKSIRIKGWALNSSGIKEVKVYIDGTYICKASLGVSREDVNALYPNYPNGNKSGYYADINLSNISYGKKKITVEEVGLDGNINYNERIFQYTKNKLVLIDAGYGGTDSGAISSIGGVNYIEKDINLKIALKLSDDLKSRGYDVELIRSLDSTVSLKERAQRANNLEADLFISIHQNSVTSSLANGTEVYYTTSMPDSGFPVHQTNKLSKSKEVASLVCNNVVSALGTTNRGVKIGDFRVLRNTSMPSILIECGFITNKTDALKISNETYQNKISKAIGEAIESQKYLDTNLNIISFSASKASPQIKGSEITLKASASGEGNLQYKFVVSDLKGNTTLIKDYSNENTALWNANYVGDKILTVYVKDSHGNISKKTMSYCIKPITIKISSFTADKSSPQVKGSKITLKASASGDGNLKYKFVVSDLNDNTTLIKDYSNENTALWNANYVGDKILTVYIKDSHGNISKKTMSYCIKSTTVKISNFIADKLSPQKVGSKITLTLLATGGEGTLKYKFIVKDLKGNEVVLQDYSTSNKVIWNTKYKGDKILIGIVKSSNGQEVKISTKYTIQ